MKSPARSAPFRALRTTSQQETVCDEHPDRPAVTRVQGETDSMGCEMHDLCEECAAEHRAYARSTKARSGCCAWCKAEATDLRDTRDYEEGLNGPVYRVCGTCYRRQQDRLNAELDQHYYADDGGPF